MAPYFSAGTRTDRIDREGRYVALKISVSERTVESRELATMQAIQSNLSGCPHLVQMLDRFECQGPNGNHDCLVLELLGPSVSELLDERFNGERLPGQLAKSIARQALLGLDHLHEQGIGHGGEFAFAWLRLQVNSHDPDIHIRNLAFSLPSVNSLDEVEFLRRLGKPETAAIERKDGEPLEPGVPQYLVRPTFYAITSPLLTHPIKIIDFGESFCKHTAPRTLHTPLPIRAPEVIFGDPLDHRVDLWSMGCTLFELVVGQPPFDSFMVTPPILVRQMLEMANDKLPERWQPIWRTMQDKSANESFNITLKEWLEDMYFDGERNEDLTRKDIIKLGNLISRLILFEPSSRSSAADLLLDSWFKSG